MTTDDHARHLAVGVVLVLAATVASVAVLGPALGAGTTDPVDAAFRLSVDPGSDRLSLVHAGGDSLDPERLRLRISVEGDPIAHQPPVPFFSARGFHSGPTGPFNSATGGEWTAGERASLRLAGTNTELRPGDRVVVELYRGEQRLAALETWAC